MAGFLSLPIELMHEVLNHLQPITELPHPVVQFNPDEWDIRHWCRTLAALARTCRVFRNLAVPLLYTYYEARFQIPIHAFVDRVSSDVSIQKGLKSVITRSSGPRCPKYKPSKARRALYKRWVTASGSELKQYGLGRRRRLTADECAQLEVWRLVSQAPNLRVLSVMTYWTGVNARDLPPVWLLPVALAAARIQIGLGTNGWFDHLHTLEVEMTNKCGVYLALFFQLPSLERLSISSVQWFPLQDSTPWPEPNGNSKVHTLALEGMEVRSSFIVRMVGYCRELISFKCDRCHDQKFTDDSLDSTEAWCTDILNSLQRHSESLRELVLEPFDAASRDTLDLGFKHLDTIRSLAALEVLEVPSMVLLGRPPDTVINMGWSAADDWRYPLLSEVLPPKLQKLILHMDHLFTPGHLGLDDSLLSGLPTGVDTHSSIKNNGLVYLRLDNMYMRHDGTLPMNFWQVQDAFKTVGSSFSYEIILDIDDIYGRVAPLEAEINVVAQTLSTYGPKGVQMALEFRDPTLPRRVMDILDLSKEWLQSEEANKMLFGQSCDYDAVDARQLARGRSTRG